MNEQGGMPACAHLDDVDQAGERGVERVAVAAGGRCPLVAAWVQVVFLVLAVAATAGARGRCSGRMIIRQRRHLHVQAEAVHGGRVRGGAGSAAEGAERCQGGCPERVAICTATAAVDPSGVRAGVSGRRPQWTAVSSQNPFSFKALFASTYQRPRPGGAASAADAAKACAAVRPGHVEGESSPLWWDEPSRGPGRATGQSHV